MWENQIEAKWGVLFKFNSHIFGSTFEVFSVNYICFANFFLVIFLSSKWLIYIRRKKLYACAPFYYTQIKVVKNYIPNEKLQKVNLKEPVWPLIQI